MRKLVWIFVGLLVLASLGNLIGGTDVPADASVNRSDASSQVRLDIPASPSFDSVLYVTASSLNIREAPTTSARVITTLSRRTAVKAGERRGNWVQVSANGNLGWVSGDYLTETVVAPIVSPPTQNQPRLPGLQQSQQGVGSCPTRRYCSQIGSCDEAHWYLDNCTWGTLLDRDNDGVPCEAMCR